MTTVTDYSLLGPSILLCLHTNVLMVVRNFRASTMTISLEVMENIFFIKISSLSISGGAINEISTFQVLSSVSSTISTYYRVLFCLLEPVAFCRVCSNICSSVRREVMVTIPKNYLELQFSWLYW